MIPKYQQRLKEQLTCPCVPIQSLRLVSHHYIHTSTTSKPATHIADILSPYPSATTPLLESLGDELPPSVVVALVAAAMSPPLVGVGVKTVLAIPAIPPESPVVIAPPSRVYVGTTRVPGAKVGCTPSAEMTES